ncbi:hypothetical protein DFR71_2127 [Nocardia alba]|uniref:Uncharacterized protein n=1 Tax=Nocardia alba TaxID=225051 RepID=A0A4R1G401_9NOCA|nr:hypothetical protein DFR71_2127 [Nocardia alba]
MEVTARTVRPPPSHTTRARSASHDPATAPQRAAWPPASPPCAAALPARPAVQHRFDPPVSTPAINTAPPRTTPNYADDLRTRKNSRTQPPHRYYRIAPPHRSAHRASCRHPPNQQPRTHHPRHKPSPPRTPRPFPTPSPCLPRTPHHCPHRAIPGLNTPPLTRIARRAAPLCGLCTTPQSKPYYPPREDRSPSPPAPRPDRLPTPSNP